MEQVRIFVMAHGEDNHNGQAVQAEQCMNTWLATNPGCIRRVLQSSSGAHFGESSRTVITVFYEASSQAPAAPQS